MATTSADEAPPTGSANGSHDSAGVWFAADPGTIPVRQWGSEWLVFHEPSGETHLLSPLAVALCRHLQAGGGPEATLVGEALKALDCPEDPELEALARQTLEHLGAIGLARRRAR